MITDPSAILVICTSLRESVLFFLLKEAHFMLARYFLAARCAIRGLWGSSSPLFFVSSPFLSPRYLPLDHFGGLLLAWYSSDILTVLREPEEQANRRGYARADQCRRDSSLVWIPGAPHRKLRRGRGSDPSI